MGKFTKIPVTVDAYTFEERYSEIKNIKWILENEFKKYNKQ